MDEKFDDGVEKRGKAWNDNKRIDQRSILHDRLTLRVCPCIFLGRILEVAPIGALPIFGVRVIFRFSKIEKIFGVRMMERKVISRCESGVSRNYSPGFIFNTIKKYIGSMLAGAICQARWR